MIYKYTLVDEEYSVRFEACVSRKDDRYTLDANWRVKLDADDSQGIVDRLYRRRPGPPDRDDLPTSPRPSLSKASTSFWFPQRFRQFNSLVSLLQTCRQINAGAAPLFYG
jgi:hypothetical protein